MKIWIVQLDPETEHLDPYTPIREHKGVMNDDHFLTEAGRKINTDSIFYKIFESEETALSFRLSSLNGLKKKLRKDMREVNKEIEITKIRKRDHKNVLIRLYLPDGTDILRTRTQAGDITGLSRGGIFQALERGHITRGGYRMEKLI